MKPAAQILKVTVIVVISVSAFLATVGAIAGFIPGIWLCDLASQFRIPYFVTLTVCAATFPLLRIRAGTVFALIALIINIVPIVSMLPARKCESATGKQLTILNFNTEFQHNDHIDLLEKLIEDRDPDIVALVEIDKHWVSQMQPFMKRYPYSKIALSGPGIAMFSKLPIEHCEVRTYGQSHHPRILSSIRLGSQSVQLILAHPPTPQTEVRYRERNEEFEILRNEIASMATPKLLVGDFNCGPWSPAFVTLLRDGLADSEQGFGPQPSWPARKGRVIDGVSIPPLIPIDHVFVSDDISVVERRIGPAMQSDHLPVFVKLSIGR